MDSSYSSNTWSKSREEEIIQCLEDVFSRRGYTTKNFHIEDRVNELGTDLKCLRDNEKIEFAVKKKPKKKDIQQLKTFSKSTNGSKKIYVYVEPPTRFFESSMRLVKSVTFWDAYRLHEELIDGESIRYICLLFSNLPISNVIAKAYEIVYDKRKTNYQIRKLTFNELDRLWTIKDNVVKMRSMLLNISTRWTKKLMTKSIRTPEEYNSMLEELFEELDIVNLLTGKKLTSSFEEIAEKNPDLFGLFWENARQRTNWKDLVVTIEKRTQDNTLDFLHYWWFMPKQGDSTEAVMRGFYSTLNYILERFHEALKNLEDGIDWVFEDMAKEC